MLGRLRMSIRDCIDAYIRLSDKIFKKIHYSPVNWKVQTQGRFDHEALETAIKDVVISAGLSEDALLKDDQPDSCKVLARLGIHQRFTVDIKLQICLCSQRKIEYSCTIRQLPRATRGP